MRTVLNKQEKKAFFGYPQRLMFKWTISRGCDTFGYNICSLYVNEEKATNCKGGGYDMRGTVLADWMEETFPDQLKKLKGNSGSGDVSGGFYGLHFYNPSDKVYKMRKTAGKGCQAVLDGGCGIQSMENILHKIGFKIVWVGGTKNQTNYMLEPCTFNRQGGVK